MQNSPQSPPQVPREGLRVLVVTSIFPPAVGGGAEYFRINLGVWQNHPAVDRIVVLTEIQKGHPCFEVWGKAAIWRLLPPRDSKDTPGWLYRTLSLPPTWFIILALAGYLAILRRVNVGLIHGRYGRRVFISALNCLPLKVVFILTDLLMDPRSLADSDAVICVSEGIFNRARSRCPTAKNLFYIPLPFERPKPGDSTSFLAKGVEPFILYVGGIMGRKGAPELFRAFARFRRTFPNYSLVATGPLLEKRLRSEAGDHVVLLGAVKHEAVLDLMRRAEVVILPSKSEGLPRACLEAIALGKKVICPPNVPEFLRSCPEFVLPSISEEHIVEKLREVIQAKRLPTYPFEQHEPDAVAGQIVEVCRSLL